MHTMTSLPGYTLMETLREDDELALYRGRSNDLQIRVLLTTPSAERPPPSTFLRLEHEFSLRADLASEVTVQPLKLERYQGRTVLVLKDPGGDPLARFIRQPLDLNRFLHIGIELAAALSKVHGLQLIHRDIKPANIFFNETNGKLFFTGFGISSRLLRERQSADPPEVIAGTFAYISPEQTGRMNRSVDSRSDLYSLGVTFYQMLTGVLPFTASDPMEWIHCHIARTPLPPTEHTKDIPASVSSIVMKLLEKTAEQRYQTATGLEADLRKCLSQWESLGNIEPFSLGTHDVSARFIIPEKLYGRERESRALFNAFERIVADGKPELVLVSGYSGMGKSSLVTELHKAIAQSRGLFASGKFDQYQRDIPYTTLAQAFQGIVRQILCKSEREITHWRNSLSAELDRNAQLIVDLIPELGLIIGNPAPLPLLATNEAKNRFQTTFQKFLAVFAKPEHPLVLFLDDLQWIDTASLKLFEYLITHPESSHFLLIGAYRDNEVTPAHPLMLTLDGIGKTDVKIHRIILEPLSLQDINQLVADTLVCEPNHAALLAELVHDKTEGNVFFAIQFLQELWEERLLLFDVPSAAWHWNIDRIRAKEFTDNVIELMIGKLKRLPDTAKEILKPFACLGNTVNTDTLAMVGGRTPETIHTGLWEAVRGGFLYRYGDMYKFLHDRIQEAAYALIPESSRAEEHLRIGRLLASEMTDAAMDDEIFAVVNQLNRGGALIEDKHEKALLRRLNLRAGRKAKSSIAYAAARNYLTQASAFSSPDAWSSKQYDETFTLYMELSECEFLIGNFDRARELSKLVIGNARTALDRAKVYALRMRLYPVAGRYDEAINAGLEALRLFGVNFPQTDEEIREALEKEKREIAENMQGRVIAEILDAPVATDPVIRTTIALLVDVGPCLAVVRPGSPLFSLVVLKAVNFSLRYGNIEKSCYAFSIYSRMLITEFGDVAAGSAFAEMALQLNEKFEDATLRGTLLFFHGVYLNNWRRPIATSIPILEQAFTASLDAGNYVYASFSAFFLITHVMGQGESLDEVLKVSEKYLGFARQIRNEVVYQAIRLYQQVAGYLTKPSAASSDHNDESSEAERFPILAKAGFAPSIAGYYIIKQNVCFLYEQYADAAASAASVAKVLAPGGIAEVSYYFYHALTLIALQREAGREKWEETIEALAVPLKKLKFRAESSPENYLDRYALVCAELAALENRILDAQRGYEKAIAAARDSGSLQNEGLANELAGKFYLAQNYRTTGYAYLRDAHYCYLRWGATGKVKHLEYRYPKLTGSPQSSAALSNSSASNLDVMTVVKASQALSGEIVLGKLVEKLMTIVLENAGAVRGLLIVPKEESYLIIAEATTGQTIDVRLCNTPVTPAALPESIFRYAIHTHEKVTLDDASASHMFSSDAYVRRTHARSVLFLPLIHQAKLVGLLYLENNLAASAFTPDRLSVLELLSSQASISLENARLYDSLEFMNRTLEAKVIARTEALQAAKQEAEFATRAKSDFLANMSHELRTPLNAILGYTQLFKYDRNLDERQVGGLHTIEQSGMHLLTLINDLLDLSKIEAGKFELYLSAVDLREFLTVIANIMRVKAEEKGLQFGFELASDLPAGGSVDEKRLRQVLLNLLGNAVKFTDSGRVTLRVQRVVNNADTETARLRFEVQDTGIGMSEDQLSFIFKPFEQVGDVQRRSGGTGLGLSISRQLVRLMNSEIQVRSQVNGGSVFSFELTTAIVNTETTEHAPMQRITGYEGAPRKILIVDDIANNRTMLADLLKKLGFAICEAANGQEGLDQVQAATPDIVLMDIVMPVMNGLEAVRRIREIPDSQRIPIIMLSASVSSPDLKRSLSTGANAFMSKPVDHAQLLHLIGLQLGLQWIFDQADGSQLPDSGTSGELVVPPLEEMKIVHALALVGNMRSIIQYATHLINLDESYRPFADKLTQLARAYQSKALLALVEDNMEQV